MGGGRRDRIDFFLISVLAWVDPWFDILWRIYSGGVKGWVHTNDTLLILKN